jgi:dipeptidyl aminopeptidase/acylaminoacyl peptidase
MKSIKKLLIITLLLNVILTSTSFGQAKSTSVQIDKYNEYLNFRSFIKNISVIPHWCEDGSKFWYAEKTTNFTNIYIIDPAKKTKKELINTNKLIIELSKYLKYPIKDEDLAYNNFQYNEKNNTLKLQINDTDLLVDIINFKIEKSNSVRKTINEEQLFSPDKKQYVFIRNNNLYLFNINTEELIELTNDGIENNTWSIPDNAWSNDGTKLFVKKSDTRKVHQLPIINYSNPNEKVEWNVYAKTGDNIEKTDLFIIDTKSKQKTPIGIESTDYYIFPVGWRKDNSEVLFLRLDRICKTLDFFGANPINGKTRIILIEKQNTFVAGMDFIIEKWKKQATILDDSKHFVWMSERDGYNHLYLYDFNGNLITQLTNGEFPVIEVIKVDEKNKWVYFYANAEHHLYYTNLYRVNFKGETFKKLSEGIGKHRIIFSPSGKYFIDKYSTPTNPPIIELRSSEGKLLNILKTTDTSKLEQIGWTAPENFVVKADDGKTDIYGILYKPNNFDPTKKYPIVEFIYAGPIEPIVPTNFIPNTSLSIQAQALAQLGYITFLIDSRGTTERSKSFQDVVYKNIGKYEIPDRLAALKQLVKQRPYMDIKRVGIFGHSWGGYFAIRAMLMAPEIYKVGIASAPGELTEGAEINEPYMDLPNNNKLGYQFGLNINNAEKLNGKLLFIHGTSDINAPFSTTVQMIDALIKAGKPYDLLLLPQQTHFYDGIYEKYVNEKVMRYFEENLK